MTTKLEQKLAEALRKQGAYYPLTSEARSVLARFDAAQQAREQPLPVRDEWGAFENWADDQGHLLQRTIQGDGYQDLRTEGAWWAWQARAAIPQPAPEAQQGDLATLCAEVAKYLGSGWLVIGPDGSRFQGPTPHRAANAASKHHRRMVYDPAKAAEFAALIAEAQRKSAEENERLLESFGSLDCPACGGSGHVGDTKPESPQPAQAVPLSAMQARHVVNSMGWNLDAHEAEDLEKLLRATERACASAWGVKLAGGGEGV